MSILPFPSHPTQSASLHFTNRFARELPAEFFYTAQHATPFVNPHLISWNAEVASLLDLPPAFANTSEATAWFHGAALPQGAEPIATVYSGHQFGQWAGQLGDGRALMLGEVQNAAGEHYEIQIKGSGKTPYSRFGDGRAVLRSSIREYLASEAMHALGIPTTRALCLIGSDEMVLREQPEPGAMVTRVAPSFIRFGHFEHFYYFRNDAALRQLIDFVVRHFYPDYAGRDDATEKLFYEATVRTARTIAQWQVYGFAHGVLNTDNMSILGLTLDYGPFGFLDAFAPNFVPNHSDHTGRYSFAQQPSIGLWNLKKLAVALSDLVSVEQMQTILTSYEPTLLRHYYALMQQRMGLITWRGAEDSQLIVDFMQLLAEHALDYTLAMRGLCALVTPADFTAYYSSLHASDVAAHALAPWLMRYLARLKEDGIERGDHPARIRMRQMNPCMVLRNHICETAIRAAEDEGDYAPLDALMRAAKSPFTTAAEHPEFYLPAPAWAADLCISCSS